MTTSPTVNLLEALRQYRLLDPARLDDLSRKLQGKKIEARALAQQLIAAGLLTPYQANQLLQGRGRELVLGSYLVLERIGEGGMGQVFKARHQTMDRVVALKLIHKERVQNPTIARRFRREIQAAALLEHPHIVRAFDADEVGGTLLLVMEFVAGTDLARLVKDKGPLAPEKACDYIRQAALGLQHAHEKGMVHRDVKPHNLLLSTSGGSRRGETLVKILDFGLARVADGSTEDSHSLTQQGLVVGTVDYIAPEQAIDSHRADIRADLYSLGCTLYFLLTGRVPFPGGDALGKLMKHRLDEPAPVTKFRSDVPPGVIAVLHKLMAKRPEERFQTPAELAAVLAAGIPTPAASSPVPVAAPVAYSAVAAASAPLEFSSPARSPRRRAKSRLLVPVMIGGLLVCLVALVVGFASHSGKTASSDRAVARGGSAASSGKTAGRLGTSPTSGKTNPTDPGEPGKDIANSIGMKLVPIPAGDFRMGSSIEDVERFKKEPFGFMRPDPTEGPQHRVKITRAFYMGVHPVTQGEYETVMHSNPSFNKESTDHPVESVNWYDAVEFCKVLSALREEQKAGRRYRLPTEAEWEYACRAGTTTATYFGNSLSSRQANFDGDKPLGGAEKGLKIGKTVKVGSYPPNIWGLRDMYGNVWQWCQDGPRIYKDELVEDPVGPDTDAKGEPSRVMRGGAFREGAPRSAVRKARPPMIYRGNYLGFRVVCELRGR